jgi:uncharacterized protein
MIVKVHKSKDGKTVVAACDDELRGKVFEEGNKQLDLSSDFYAGDKLTDKEAGDLIRNADMINLVGEKAVKLGVDEDVIDTENIIKIEGIPFAQGVVVHE